MTDKSSTIYRDESKLHNVPDWVIYAMPLVLLLELVLGVIIVLNFMLGTINYYMVSSFLLCIIWGKFVDLFFNFYNNCRYDFSTKSVVYRYDLSSSILPQTNCTVKIEVFKITKLRVRKKSVTVWGTISKTAPRQATKTLNKVDLRLDFKERDLILEKLYTLKDRR